MEQAGHGNQSREPLNAGIAAQQSVVERGQPSFRTTSYALLRIALWRIN
jgi:hypothetical protein